MFPYLTNSKSCLLWKKVTMPTIAVVIKEIITIVNKARANV